jgi:hypothetical protein
VTIRASAARDSLAQQLALWDASRVLAEAIFSIFGDICALFAGSYNTGLPVFMRYLLYSQWRDLGIKAA